MGFVISHILLPGSVNQRSCTCFGRLCAPGEMQMTILMVTGAKGFFKLLLLNRPIE